MSILDLFRKKEKSQSLVKHTDAEIFQRLLSITLKYRAILDIEKRIRNLPDIGGDGDEYPVFDVNKDWNSNMFGSIFLGYQEDPVYRWNENHWEDHSDYNRIRRVNNLKQDIIKHYTKCQKDWSINRYWDEDSDKVINHISLMIKIIKGSNL